MEDVRLTKDFPLEEMLRSVTATIRGYTEQFDPPQHVKEALKKLCEKILQPLRTHVDRAVDVSSGYRCDRLNSDKSVKGSKKSQHRFGQAADIKVKGMTVDEVMAIIIELELPFDQMIHEFNRWVHVSFGPRNRRQILKAVKKKDGSTAYYNYSPPIMASRQ